MAKDMQLLVDKFTLDQQDAGQMVSRRRETDWNANKPADIHQISQAKARKSIAS
jgi:hypothetical protein